tara:strand:+ start:43 stop:447 length:405 start_codon:yes stop_codon:yes gene_type:complete
MSDYEYASLFFTIMEAAQATFANFLAIVSGMIAVSYFFAHKLDRTLSSLLLLIFSLFALGFINELFAAYSDFARLAAVIGERGGMAESALGWMGPVVNGAGGIAAVPWIILSMTLASYVATIWFFFHARKMDRV